VIVVAGEALVDLVERRSATPVPGGGPFNTAIALGRLGLPVAYLGTLSVMTTEAFSLDCWLTRVSTCRSFERPMPDAGSGRE